MTCSDLVQLLVFGQYNNHFSSVAGKLQASIHSQGQDFNSYLQNKSECSFFVKATNKYEIVDTITSNINNKASGPNSIPNEILLLIKESIAKPLADIINLSFSTGIYIEKLKISKIIPIFKEKGDILLTKNFRPISLLSNINKIFEKLMHKRLYDFLEKQEFIFENQFGFRKRHSTNHVIVDFTEDIKQETDGNKFACGVFMDV